MIANGVVISRLIYLIQLWGGCQGYLLDLLQTIQNKAARLVCNSGRYTPIKTLLDNCGWMSVRQMVTYHRVLLVFKIRLEGNPKYFVEKFSSSQNPIYQTRFVDDGGIKKSRNYKKDDPISSFVPSSIETWNNLPLDIRKSENVMQFKTKLKIWIKRNVEI